MNRQHDIEPYWQDEDDWLCTVEFLPSDDLEGRVFAADIVGYLFGYRPLNVPGIDVPKFNLKVGPLPSCGDLRLRPIRKLRVFSRRKVAVVGPSPE